MGLRKVHWERRSAEDPLTLMKRGALKLLCIENDIDFNHSTTSARELREKLRERGIYGHKDAS